MNRFADKVDGIFTPNESSTAGMLLALQDIGKAGAITFVGFDYSSSFLEPLQKGELKGFVAQNPVNMGYLGVKTMVDHLRGQAVPKTVDTGVVMVTLDNLNEPAIQAVINPTDATSHAAHGAMCRVLSSVPDGHCGARLMRERRTSKEMPGARWPTATRTGTESLIRRST